MMLSYPLRALSWLGSQGTRAVATLVFIAVAVPPLGRLLRPFITEAIVLLLCISFMRVDVSKLRRHLARPGTVVIATAWTTLGVPLMVGLVCLLIGLDQRSPGLFLALMLQAMASPMMASPAIAALMGLDATLVLVVLVSSTTLVPFTASLFATAFLGETLGITPIALGLKLLVILSASALAAVIIRRVFGMAAIERQKRPIDGVNIIILLIFAAAVMGDVASDFMREPVHAIEVGLLAFAIYFGLLAVTTLLFRRIGHERALALGIMVAQRNLGLMLAATAGALPPSTWLYFALTQFPIHLAPYILTPLARRLAATTTSHTTSAVRGRLS